MHLLSVAHFQSSLLGGFGFAVQKKSNYTPLLLRTVCLLISEKISHLHGFWAPTLIRNFRVGRSKMTWKIKHPLKKEIGPPGFEIYT